MIESLFGDLAPRPVTAPGGRAGGGTALAPTATDVVVDDSPADAIRGHFADQRARLEAASPMITLVDPAQLWAGPVLQALSQAAGQPLQRLSLRDRHTLRTLAVIERTLVPRHGSSPLRVYHADLSGAAAGFSRFGHAGDDIALTLAEGSQLTAVIVGAMQPQALAALLRTMLVATQQPAWRCGALVFLVPPGTQGTHDRILDQPWPADLRVRVLAEPLGSASGVWNSVLSAWETDSRSGLALPADPDGRPGLPARPHAAAPGTARTGEDGWAATSTAADPRPWPTAPALGALLALVARNDGVLACAVVDLQRGDVLASVDHRDSDEPPLAGVVQALRAARQAHQLATPGQPAPDEVLMTAGARQMLLRSLPEASAPALAVVALLARARVNLSLLRFKLLDADKLLTGP